MYDAQKGLGKPLPALLEESLRGRTVVPERRSLSLGRLLERQSVLGPVLVSGAILYMLALVGYPFALALYLSVSDANVATNGLGNFVGFANFVSLFESSVFLTALRNTLFFTFVAAVFKSLMGTSLAFLLAENLPGTRIFRLIILLPWTIPIALSSITWKWMFDSQYSIINWIGTHLGLIHGNPIWLGDPNLAAISIIVVNIWRGFPFAAIILLAGLTSIPQDIIDAAKVDGANGVVRFRKVIVPMIAPILFIGGLYDLVFSLTDMTVVNLLTQGGPANGTHVLASYAFLVGVQSGALGRGAAIAVLLLPILLVVVILVLRSLRRREF
ncbi:MAG: sugar ABC transporter permease [Chloroflexota bacterium]|nr:sugar ABC transporter permease [Chloroflexota bacterium]